MKIEDVNQNNSDTSGVINEPKVANEVGGNENGSMWVNYGRQTELKGTGLKKHESPKLTEEQEQQMRAPVNDTRAKLENAVRYSKKYTPPLEIGKLDSD